MKLRAPPEVAYASMFSGCGGDMGDKNLSCGKQIGDRVLEMWA